MSRSALRTAPSLLAGVMATALLLVGCVNNSGSGDSSQVSQEEIDEALNTPTDLLFWTWVGDIEDEVALFEEAYPAIDVTVENIGQGGAHYTALRTALEAGTGLPDLVQMEYQLIPSFVFGDELLDLAPYGANDIAGEFEEWVWNQVAFDDAVYAVPQDSGPMGNLYREDILQAAGIEEAPATWDDYLEAARSIQEHTQGATYITSFPDDPGQMLGLLWASGVTPFSYDGAETLGIELNSGAAKEALEIWQQLLDEDLVSTDAAWTDTWYQGLANGKYASWLTAAWGPLFLSGIAGDTAGSWRAAPLPQADASQPTSGNWGGSTSAVLSTSENPIAAYTLAKFLNTDPESTTSLTNEKFLFPVTHQQLGDAAFLETEVEFYGGQQVNQVFVEISTTVDKEFQWLPIHEFVANSYYDEFLPVIASGGRLADGLDAWQAAVVSYAETQGFTVN